MKAPVINAAIDKLRRAADHPEARRWLTESDRVLIALADLVDQTVSGLAINCLREMTANQLRLIQDLRDAVTRRGKEETP